MTAGDIPRDGTELEPGLYCMQGNFDVHAHDEIIGHGVTFVIYGDITINAKATVILTAPQAEPDPSPALPGVVIYVPRDPPNATCPDQTVTINGTSDSYFEGMILAPCATISINGTGSSSTYSGQIIGWNVKVGGNADTGVVYNEEYLRRDRNQNRAFPLKHTLFHK